jgi:hypothetical protein
MHKKHTKHWENFGTAQNKWRLLLAGRALNTFIMQFTYFKTDMLLCFPWFIHSFSNMTRGPQPFPKPVPHTVLTTASYVNFKSALFPLISFSSSYVFFLVFPSLSSFLISFLEWPVFNAVPTLYVTNTGTFPSLYFTACITFLCSAAV